MKASGFSFPALDTWKGLQIPRTIVSASSISRGQSVIYAVATHAKICEYRLARQVSALGDETLRAIAQELVRTARANVTIDWTLRENVRAQLRVLVKRILRKCGYPPDKQEKATQTVLEQAALLSAEWAAA